jgi:hypothetical protein
MDRAHFVRYVQNLMLKRTLYKIPMKYNIFAPLFSYLADWILFSKSSSSHRSLSIQTKQTFRKKFQGSYHFTLKQ